MRAVAYARPSRLRYKPRHDAVSRTCAEAVCGIVRTVGVVGDAIGGAIRTVGAGDRGLVGQDEHIAQPAELLGDRSDVVVADQDVLVFFLDQFVSWRHYYFDDVLARGQHGRAVGGVGDTNGAVGTGNVRVRSSNRLACRWISSDNAGELVHTVVWRRLQLVPVVHAVVALELRVVRQRCHCGDGAVLEIIEVEVVGLVEQAEEEEIRVGAGRSALTGGIGMFGLASGWHPCAQSSQLLVLVVSMRVRVVVPSGAVPSW